MVEQLSNQTTDGGSNPTSPLQILKQLILDNHYTHSLPSGKSHYIQFESAVLVFSIPANKNIAKFILGRKGNVWELARLWAPDGHRKNLLTEALKVGVAIFRKLEPTTDALVSYADPNEGHTGGVYRAASWVFLGQCEESRNYVDSAGRRFARRKFHAGRRNMTKKEIEASGFKEVKLPGKFRFAKGLTKSAKSIIADKAAR
jgi:hypothetical protein